MRRLAGGSALILLGVMLVAGVVFIVGAATNLGRCYYGPDTTLDCTGSNYQENLLCTDCFSNYEFAAPVWKAYADDRCVTTVGECGTTAVTIMGFKTPITACNAQWAVPSLGAVGIVASAAGIVVLKRKER